MPWNPRLWASPKPFGIGEGRPNNYAEIWRAVVENRDNLGYAWRILNDGVCDGCALGTSGMRDWTLDEIHLCNIRLRLLRLNTMPVFDPSVVSDVETLRGMSGRELRELGRIPRPLIRNRGDAGFRPVSWDEALDLAAERIRRAGPDRIAFYLTSRGMPNESYYGVQKAVRALGTNSVDNAARICHSPSTFALRDALGVAATTCSYRDLVGSDLVVFFGSNVANNQPVMMKYLYHAKKAGTRVVVVNPYREPGMDRYWVPSNLESALFGTKIADRFFQVNVGGDIAFLLGTLRVMVERGLIDRDFVDRHTVGFDRFAAHLATLDWSALEAESGLSTDDMVEFAEMVGRADTAVFVWSMGVTQHAFGEDNVRAIIDLALTRGFVGREKCGLMPIRGHSGVQGGAEMGAYSTVFPGGEPIGEESARRLSALWGFDVPTEPGLTAPEMIDAAWRGDLEVLFSAGGNFLEVLPDPPHVEQALARIPLRIHMDLVLSTQMLVDPAEVVLILPAKTRYEVPGGVTETSTERRVIFSPEIPGPRPADARAEWEVAGELAARVRPDLADRVRFADTAAIRAEIARTVPLYEGIQRLRRKGDQFQYGGPHLCWQWRFPTPDGKAHWSVVDPPGRPVPPGSFLVATRRGKQFNSMIHEAVDPLNAVSREAVLMSRIDAETLGLANGDRVVLTSAHGRFTGRVVIAPIAPGNLQVHWPEGEVLIDRNRRSPQAGIPDYNAVVTVEPVGAVG
ncbi:MAG: formate dehydrogenase [Acidimicrobiia bacterium]|nr:MAG: formate dehydrogenase [Acidimicrobiia bacterium]